MTAALVLLAAAAGVIAGVLVVLGSAARERERLLDELDAAAEDLDVMRRRLEVVSAQAAARGEYLAATHRRLTVVRR